MRRTKVIIIIAIVVLLVMTGYLFVFPLQSDTSQSINEQECQERVELQPNDTIIQTFQCEVEGLNKITFQSPYKAEGVQYHAVVKLDNQVIADQKFICKNANGIAKISFDAQKSMNKNITVEITNDSQEVISLPKENKTENTLNMTYYGLADNYFFAWYPLFAAAILTVIVTVI